MIGKTMITLRSVVSAEDKPRQSLHKFMEEEDCEWLWLLEIFVNQLQLLSHSLTSCLYL